MPPLAAATHRRKWHRMPDLVGVIAANANEPWVPLTLGGESIASVRRGGLVVVMGPTGAGKSSLAAGFLVEHARERGPVIVLSRELPADELAARAIGMQLDASWSDVLTGKLPHHEMERVANLPRMAVLERRDANLAGLVTAVHSLKAEYPGEPILAAIDYVQIIESREQDTRARVADVIAQIDDIARSDGLVVLAISQMSRAASNASRAGEKMGVASADAGAESAAIERAATLTLAIGSSGPPREDGTCAVDLSIGKWRMGQGDRVLPMSYCGRSGRWRVAGDARAAADVKAERDAARTDRAVSTASLAIGALLAKASEPMSRRDIRSAIGGTDTTVRAAVATLLQDPASGVVEVEPRIRNAYLVWARDRAIEAGRTIREVAP